MRAKFYTSKREVLDSLARNDAVISGAPAPNPLVIPVARSIERVASRLNPSVVLPIGHAPSVSQPYSSGWTNGVVMAKEMELFFSLRGNHTRFSYLNSVIMDIANIKDNELFNCNETYFHNLFMDKWNDYLIVLLREAMLYLEEWAYLAKKTGLHKEFITVLAKHAFELSRQISKECLAIVRSVCSSRLEHARAVNASRES